jgi:hypothetical protein
MTSRMKASQAAMMAFLTDSEGFGGRDVLVLAAVIQTLLPIDQVPRKLRSRPLP